MRLEDFDYELPEGRIAQEPLEERVASALLVAHRDTGALEDRHFGDIVTYLRSGDLLVMNDTRVIPARIFAHKATGGRIELLLLEETSPGLWHCLARPGKRLREGTALTCDDGTLVTVREKLDAGRVAVDFGDAATAWRCMESVGKLPLPPYIKTPLANGARYQTVYAEREGAVAAPTAGLHFTGPLLARLEAMGVVICRVTLHVGAGTFRPVKSEDWERGTLHSERYEVRPAASAAIAAARELGQRLVAVGTTSMRVLETLAGKETWPEGVSGRTNIFIRPGVPVRLTSALITNFHLPRTSLLMLVHAFAGSDLARRMYAHAVAGDYRFYSFGDACLIL